MDPGVLHSIVTAYSIQVLSLQGWGDPASAMLLHCTSFARPQLNPTDKNCCSMSQQEDT